MKDHSTSKAATRVAAALLMTGVAVTAMAGQKLTAPVSFDAMKPFARGNLGDARNSTDAVQYMGCTVFSGSATCIAQDLNGTQHSCSTSDPNLLAVINTLHADSYLVFRWDPQTGNCTTVIVTNDSRYAPK